MAPPTRFWPPLFAVSIAAADFVFAVGPAAAAELLLGLKVGGWSGTEIIKSIL
jgi:hypothetical protein